MGRVNLGSDVQSRQMGGDSVGDNGTTSSAPTATTVTDSTKSWTTNQWVGHAVVMGNNVIGHVLSNTGTVLTIDMWHSPTYPLASVSGGTTAGETAATTPGTGTYIIMPGNVPAWYFGLSTATRAVNAADTFLTNDGTTISELWASGGGLNRSRATYSHTTGAASYNLSKTFQAVAADGSSVQTNKMGTFQHQVTAAPTTTTSGGMWSEDLIPSAPTLIPGDSVAVTCAVSI